MPVTGTPTRRELIEELARSALEGNLGLFLGAGFSMAVVGADAYPRPLSWGHLLRRAAEEMHVGWDAITREGASYPELASRLCELYADQHNAEPEEATSLLKWWLARLSDWFPSPEAQLAYRTLLLEVAPVWIITTNYDLVVESVLGNGFQSLGPSQRLVVRRGVVPVYHLHGVRTDPDSIVITQQDYISLFRPYAYRQTRLAIAFAENTSLFLGYGLGDVNVLTALDWRRSVFSNGELERPDTLVQAVRAETPEEEPYRDESGVLVVEISEMGLFLEEVVEELRRQRTENEAAMAALGALEHDFETLSADAILAFIDNTTYRTAVIATVRGNQQHIMNQFIVFLAEVLAEGWRRAEPNGAFFAYDEMLIVLLDVFTAFGQEGLDAMHPSLQSFLTTNFEYVASWVGRRLGQSFPAARTWDERKDTLPATLVRQWRDYCEHRNRVNTIELLLGVTGQQQGA